MHFSRITGLSLYLACLAQSQSPKQDQLKAFIKDTNNQTETTEYGVLDNTTYSLRAGPRGFVLLEDTIARKKIFHFDRERQPERVVHALGHGAYGTFQSSGNWSNLTSACWLKQNASSDVFVRFSVVVAGTGGSEVGRDTHGFATKIYSACGNHDLVGNHLPSFFINDGILFPDLLHAVKAEPDKGFPTGGTAHTTAYDFFTQRPEGAYQLMNVLSDLGIPRDVRHIGGAGVHTYRFLNDAGQSTLFKWYWTPQLGYRSFVYDEATKIAGKNNNFQRVDLYNTIAAGLYPSYDFVVQTFPDDGTYMWEGIDLLDPTKVVPFEMNKPIKLGTMTLNRNPNNFFSEPENIAFAPSNVVKGVTFVPDAVLAWRLISYDDTTSHRHGSSNAYLLPINRPIIAINNNFRDGYMQPLIYEGASASTPNAIGGVVAASESQSLPYGNELVNGKIGRYGMYNDFFTQATIFWNGLGPYAQQHTVDGYRFELGHVSDPAVQTNYINKILNNIDNCLARRVAYGIGSRMPARNASRPSTFPKFASECPLGLNQMKPVTGLVVGILADDNTLSSSDLAAIRSVFASQSLLYEVVAPHQGPLTTGVSANQSYVTSSSIFYDAIIIGSTSGANKPATVMVQEFLREAYGHGKPLGAIGNGVSALEQLGYKRSSAMGIFTDGSASVLAHDIVQSLMKPGRYPQRQPLDDIAVICE